MEDLSVRIGWVKFIVQQPFRTGPGKKFGILYSDENNTRTTWDVQYIYITDDIWQERRMIKFQLTRQQLWHFFWSKQPIAVQCQADSALDWLSAKLIIARLSQRQIESAPDRVRPDRVSARPSQNQTESAPDRVSTRPSQRQTVSAPGRVSARPSQHQTESVPDRVSCATVRWPCAVWEVPSTECWGHSRHLSAIIGHQGGRLVIKVVGG